MAPGSYVRKRKRSVPRPFGRVSGTGGYFTDAVGAFQRAGKRAVPKGTFSRLGQAVGGSLGSSVGFGAAGSKLGNLFGQGIASVAGFGEYKVIANSLVHKIDEGVQIPAFGNVSAATIVCHRSYVQDIVTPTSPTAFDVTSFRINPANGSLFPWLATVANSYEQYQILGCIFQFKSLSSESASSLALGSITMATKYEADDGEYVTKNAMENSQYCVSGRPSQDLVHILECDPSVMSDPIKYNLQSGVYPTGRDPRMYDVGSFQIATSGLPSIAGEVLGELWVTYEVALYRPLLNTLHAMDKFTIASTAASPSTMICPAVKTSPDVFSTLGGTSSGSTYSFPETLGSGQYLVDVYWAGTSTTLTTNLAPTFTGCAAIGQNVRVQSGAATFFQQARYVVKLSAAGASINFGTGTPTLPGTLVGGQLYVTKISDLL